MHVEGAAVYGRELAGGNEDRNFAETVCVG
jgi:hypothetical protein